MHLTIRWKFILSIGLTLLATYLALLSWDYKWQRETATLQAQDLARERARSLASSLNERLAPGEHQANTIATAIQAAMQQHEPADQAEAESMVDQVLTQNRRQFALSVLLDLAGPGDMQRVGYALRFESFGPGRGQFGRNPGDSRSGPGGRSGAEGVRGFFGVNRGGRGGQGAPTAMTQLAPISPSRVQRYLTEVESLTQGEWIALRPDEMLPEAGPLCIYATPIVLNDKNRGYVITGLPVRDLPQFLVREPQMGGRRGEPPTTEPTTQSALLDELAFTIIGTDGHMIWPPAPPPPREAGGPRGPMVRPATQPSIIDAALHLGDEALAQDIRTALAGETRVVRVSDLPQLVPGMESGENYWVALAPIATTGWVVTSAIPESQFLARIVDRLYQRGEFLLAGLAVLLAIITFISIRISRPIEKMAAAVHQLAAGNLDAQVKDVASGDELGQLAGAFNTMTRQLRQHVAALTEQTKARESVESEMRIARQIQTDLLPRKFPPFPDRKEFELHAVNVPAKRVAGDFYDFFFTPNGLLTIAVADVSGKGMPAALLMAVTRTMIRNLANEGLSPQQIAERANQMLLADLSDSMFVTLFLCQYDPGSGKIVYVNAGHPRPYVFGEHDIPKQFGEVTGALLGVHTAGADWAYEQREDQLQPGQTILIYTDGVTEARSPQGIMLRDSGLEQLIGRFGSMSVEAICSGLVDELNKYQNGQPADDVTLVALRRK